MRRSRLVIGCQSRVPEASVDESIDGCSRPVLTRVLGDLGGVRGDEGPVRAPVGVLLDPGLEHVDLVWCELPVGIQRGHSIFAFGVDPSDESTGFRLPRNDGGPTTAWGQSAGACIKPKVRLPGRGIRTMACEAVVGQDRQHVTVEVDRLCSLQGGRGCGCRNGKDQDPRGGRVHTFKLGTTVHVHKPPITDSSHAIHAYNHWRWRYRALMEWCDG